jgi:hypothetical protein
MRKYETCKFFEPSEPRALEKLYSEWVTEQCTVRESNAVVASIPFPDGIRERSILSVGDGKFALAVFYTDFTLEEPEKGGARSYDGINDGASAFGGRRRPRK